MPKPIIAVPADIRHFTGADWHAAQNQYLSAALKVADVMSFIVPAFEEGNEVDAILDRVDGLLVSGSAAMYTLPSTERGTGKRRPLRSGP